MKKSILLALFFAGLAIKPAMAAGPYISTAAGMGIPGNLNESGGSWGVDNSLALNEAVGYDFNGARVEAAVGYQNNDYEIAGTGGVSMWTFMANAFYDLNTGSDIQPYIMAGLGAAHIRADDDPGIPTPWLDETYFAWQLGAGIGCKVSKTVTIDAGYRYLRPEGIRCTFHNSDVKWETHNIMAGIRVSL
ncbi:MAG: porin family protein [Chlorobiaceae bacterium]|jgi:opacity protein-like surface antigen|nr:porin family protein [Chlorobiaceae bacterium]